MKKAWVEVDQSGRVEDLSTGTAVAFADGESAAVFISAGEKRRMINFLRRTSFIEAKDLPAVIFGVLVFHLIQGNKLHTLKIDEEYAGKNALIEETVKKLFFQNRNKNIPTIRFVRIGKLSTAHKLAWSTHRAKGRGKNIKRVLEKNILGYIGWKGKSK